MSSASLTDDAIARAFKMIEQAAALNARAPRNNAKGMRTDAANALAHRGFIRIEISGYNWRTITILKGPHAGKSTKRDAVGRVWKIVDENGTRMMRRDGTERARRTAAAILSEAQA